MGDVAITYKVMPTGLEVDLAELKTNLEKGLSEICRVNSIEKRPLAFGLNALIVQVIMKDGEGVVDRLEALIRDVPGVQNADVEDMGLI
ncbi:MAG: elongation factor 1-beta [Thermoplasmata archaeon]|nr:elongation factor 1-beta [Thermoplasmata archaeon]